MEGKQKEKFVHEVFENIAPKYDLMNSILSFRIEKSWRNFTTKKMNVMEGQTGIDVCCGTCDLTLSLANKSVSGKIIGLDFSKHMLDYGFRKVKYHQLENQISLIHGNAMELPFQDNTFDFATIGFALRNVPDINHVLSEMKRVVKPGGKIVSLELSKPTWEPFKSLYFVYLQKILPVLGKLIANKYEEYRWLPQSLVKFPNYIELKRKFEQLGLENVQAYPLTGGIAALHIGIKAQYNKV
ncbi:demethylmenaquinone methyltransferase [Paenibacillus tyrfis]|uniref:demethylmenaquinone methyltransferase n=1 Tax=Paenibacillus tyrfis TaxID=1501230 RepID=UPI000B58D453|nr:demethylmenaquinone methyltransferase [Paenibacillus tyrfis]